MMYSDYDKTGRIFGTFFGDSLEQIQKEVLYNRNLIEGEYDGRVVYVNNGEIAERPIFVPGISATTIKADGVEQLVISNIPSNQLTIYILSGAVEQTWEEEEDEMSLTVNIPGDYVLSIEAWPYQNVTVTFNAT